MPRLMIEAAWPSRPRDAANRLSRHLANKMLDSRRRNRNTPKCLPDPTPGSAMLLHVLDEVRRQRKICRRLVALWSLAPPKQLRKAYGAAGSV